MLQKHSRDVIFIVIILILIGIIWGVDKNIWALIAVNVVVIMVGLLYMNTSEEYGAMVPKKKRANNYFSLKTIAEEEINDFSNEVDYDNFESIKKGKEILEKFEVGDNVDAAVENIKEGCNYDIELYYLGLTAISMIDANLLKERDFALVSIGLKLVKLSKKIETKFTVFMKNNGF